jgi:hypothetical protein
MLYKRQYSCRALRRPEGFLGYLETGSMDEETKALIRSLAHHLRWVIALLILILAMLIAQALQ